METDQMGLGCEWRNRKEERARDCCLFIMQCTVFVEAQICVLVVVEKGYGF